MAARTGLSRGAEVGEATVTGDDVDLSFATDLASASTPTSGFQSDLASTQGDAGDQSASGGTGESAGLSTLALVGVGAATLALAVAVRWRRAPVRPN